MGLDMYLEQDVYIGGHWDFKKPTGGLKIQFHNDEGEVTETVEIPASEIQSVTKPVGYWRKANAIHKWFVDNVQGGRDECQRTYVTREKLAELRDLCQKVVDTAKMASGQVQNGLGYENGKIVPIMEDGDYVVNAEEIEALLPTQRGFFFGSTDYDQYFMEDIKRTIKIIDELPEDGDLYYHASW